MNISPEMERRRLHQHSQSKTSGLEGS